MERLDAGLSPLNAFALDGVIYAIAAEPGAPARNLVMPHMPVGATSQLVALDARTGGEVWRSPVLVGSAAQNSIQFVEIGGRRRISFGTLGAMHLTR